ncbi:MAG: relaxase/mobilization nuclease domain-containing protein [Oscillospiraceae bacterium]|nr:relaxase/mobilization nuclease domain-containing protein [Oscillospiraceae bacterium]
MVFVKVIRNTQDDSGYIFRLCRYIIRREYFVYSYGYGVDCKDPATVYEQMMRVRHYYGKTSGNPLIHYVVSFDDCVQDLKSAIEMSNRIVYFFRGRYQVFFGIHKQHHKQSEYHVHILVNSVSYVDGLMLQSGYTEVDDFVKQVWSATGRFTKSKFAEKDEDEEELVEKNKNDDTVPVIVY